MGALWDNFKDDSDKLRQTFEVEIDQRWTNANRRDSDVANQLEEIMEDLKELAMEKDKIWRVQTAQSEALKKLPLMWLEEVEKAIKHDPNSRRSPALIPVREE
jgi:hypothetical protein